MVIEYPIIFVGMHRSGTSMLGRALEKLGLFVGAQKDENNEALFFLRLNNWLMTQCGARWDMPKGISYLWDNQELLSWIESYLRELLNSPRTIQFLGWRRYMVANGLSRLSMPWGWKDPRNTFTLPLWLRIFPQAKILIIERHGVDVAQSLRMRSNKGFRKTKQKYLKYKTAIYVRPKQGGFIESPRCASLAGGFSLWKEYIDQTQQIIQQLPTEKVLKLRYEEVLEEPALHFALAAEFCRLSISHSKLSKLTVGLNSSRAYSYQNDHELSTFARNHQAELSARGYEP